MQQQKWLNSAQKCKTENFQTAGFYSIGATICTCRESWRLPYAGLFFILQFVWFLEKLFMTYMNDRWWIENSGSTFGLDLKLASLPECIFTPEITLYDSVNIWLSHFLTTLLSKCSLFPPVRIVLFTDTCQKMLTPNLQWNIPTHKYTNLNYFPMIFISNQSLKCW